jgi:hypothetical protein
LLLIPIPLVASTGTKEEAFITPKMSVERVSPKASPSARLTKPVGVLQPLLIRLQLLPLLVVEAEDGAEFKGLG